MGLTATLGWSLVIGVAAMVGANHHHPIFPQLDDYWAKYKMLYNKTYRPGEELSRRIAWQENLLLVFDHNLMAAAGLHDYFLRDNHLADLSTPQYIREMVKLLASRQRKLDENDDILGAAQRDSGCIPKSLDWRDRGFVTSTANQQDCGSCYAYSIAGVLTGQLFLRTGRVTELSEQQLVDCSGQTGNLGCSGGSLRNTLRYLERAKGIMAYNKYPYVAKQGACKYQSDLSVANVTEWAILPARDEKALEYALATIGPLAVSVNASPKTFQLYHSGIYNDPACSSDLVNHAMLLVGYTPTAWIVKNWWGANWGEDGYMRIRRDKNRCGISNYAAYAKIA